MKNKETERGNTFLVRERVRWSLFQIALAGLQNLPRT
jgi:small-conductance mechanosensitive channel